MLSIDVLSLSQRVLYCTPVYSYAVEPIGVCKNAFGAIHLHIPPFNAQQIAHDMADKL